MSELRKIQYNCRKATYLIEKRMLDKITLREKIELRIHLAGCSVCTLYNKQSRVIHQMVQQLFRDSMNPSLRRLALSLVSQQDEVDVLNLMDQWAQCSDDPDERGSP